MANFSFPGSLCDKLKGTGDYPDWDDIYSTWNKHRKDAWDALKLKNCNEGQKAGQRACMWMCNRCYSKCGEKGKLSYRICEVMRAQWDFVTTTDEEGKTLYHANQMIFTVYLHDKGCNSEDVPRETWDDLIHRQPELTTMDAFPHLTSKFDYEEIFCNHMDNIVEKIHSYEDPLVATPPPREANHIWPELEKMDLR
jgi:hypothetical protein